MTKTPPCSVNSVAALLLATVCAIPGYAQISPGNILVSRSVYSGTASTVTVGEQLPPICGTAASCTGQAISNGEFPNLNDLFNVWNNDTVDGSFGVTAQIFIDQMTPAGVLINTIAVPTSQIVTSFSSKSELGLSLSTDYSAVTFMGYLAGGANVLDASNANTTGVVDPTNPVGSIVDRAVAQLAANGAITTTDTWAYSGNNGRNAILANGLYYAVGNDNNGSQPTKKPFTAVLQELINATGVQIINPNGPLGNFQLAGTFDVTQYGLPADKPGKDTNFRGLTIFNNTLYATKGSGSNGINTVYQVGPTGALPTPADAPLAMTILPGFPTVSAKTVGISNDFPFGICFANANTLYVADEGDGVLADAGNSTLAGLQKWILTNGTWSMAYVMQNGLNLGQQYSVPNYPTSLNPATAGLRNLTCRLNSDGTVTVYALTSTVSTNGDQGADPNKLVTINDILSNTNPAVGASEQFTTIETAGYGQVLRGVSFTPIAAPLGAISLYNDQIIGLGQSAQLPIVLSSPAPAGGLTLNLSSSDPTTVTVNPPVVFIPAGATTPRNNQPMVTGINLGTATITAAGLYFTATSQQVQVTGTLTFSRRQSVFNGTTANFTLTLSGPAPAGGLQVNLTSANPGIATVPPSVTFAPNTTSVNVPVTGTGIGTTTITAGNGSADLSNATASVIVE
ncbi:MAG TPA: hypothetical protein VK789_14590 [Bryobacteraceae bacterium]|nr:hypothetical protein [Bryobacteraceae bacterium]